MLGVNQIQHGHHSQLILENKMFKNHFKPTSFTRVELKLAVVIDESCSQDTYCKSEQHLGLKLHH